MSFEKEYYESPNFWGDNMVDDVSNRIRIEETVNMVPDDCNSILDVGCGNGRFVHKLRESNLKIQITATDRSLEAMQYVNVDKFEATIDNLPVSDNSYDCVSCLEVIEHLHDTNYQQSLNEIARVAKNYILIGVPYNENLKAAQTECPKCLSKFNRDLHMRSYNDETMEKLFKSNGFSLVKEINVVKSDKLKGIDFISKVKAILKPKIEKEFDSPICLICGYKPKKEQKELVKIEQSNHIIKNNNVGGGVKSFIKNIWPKQKVDGYWIIALYKKDT